MEDQIVPPPTTRKRKKKEEVQTPLHDFQGTKMEQLQALFEQWYGCQRCLLHQFRRTDNGEYFPDVIFGDGNPDADILIVGEAPGEEEVVNGVPFFGNAGHLLSQILARVSDDEGIQKLFQWYAGIRHSAAVDAEFRDKMLEYRHETYFITNAVSCRPPDNRTPAKPEVAACWERLYNIIYIVDPKLIIASGKVALEAMLGKQQEITKVAGKIFEATLPGRVSTVTYPVMATLHPSYLLRVADFKDKKGRYAQTLKHFMDAHRFVDKMRSDSYGEPLPYRVELAL